MNGLRISRRTGSFTIFCSLVALVALASLICPQMGHCAFQTQPFVKSINGELALNLQEIEKYEKVFQSRKSKVPERLRNYTPMYLRPTSDTELVTTALLTHSIDRAVKDFGDDTPLLRQAKKMEEALRAESVVKVADVSHKIGFNVKASNSSANVKYQGYFDAHVSYHLRTQLMKVDLSKTVSERVQIVVSHLEQAQISSDNLSVRWNW